MRGVFKKVINSREGKASVALVMIYGFLLGYFIWHTFFGYIPKTYPVNWQARWIAYPGEELSQSYFLKKIYLAEKVRHAWLKVMAPDSFTVYVNGKLIGTASRPLDNVTQHFDLTQALQSGPNIIAISNYRITHPGKSKIVVEGSYEDWQGNQHRITSDASWRVSRLQEWQYLGGPMWYENGFNDVYWKHAMSENIPISKDNSKVSYNPMVYEEKINGQWVWLPYPVTQEATLRYNLDIPNNMKEVWMRIAAYQNYSIFINNVLINSVVDRQNISGTDYMYDTTLDIYNITPFLSVGRNLLTITANTDKVSRGILIDGFVVNSNHEKNVFATPFSWESAAIKASHAKEIQWETVSSTSDLTLRQQLTLKKRIVDSQPASNYRLTMFIKQVFTISLIVVAVFFVWFAIAYLYGIINGLPLHISLNMSGITILLPTLFLISIILMGYDLRHDPSYPFQSKWIVISGFLFLILNAILLLSKKNKQDNMPCQPESLTAKDTKHYSSMPSVLVNYKYPLLIAIIMLIGFVLRMLEINYLPLKTDEITSTLYTQAVLMKGIPSGSLSPHLPEKLLTTSEILPYFRAPFVKIFGANEIGMRLSGVIFSVMTIGLIYLTGKTMFSKVVGILASAVYAGHPFSINMAHYARYPSALEFFALLTVFFFYKSLVSNRTIYIYLNLLALALAFFCWEGSVLIGPGLLAGIFAVKRKDFSWLRDKHYWISGCIFVLIFFFQMSIRYIVNQGRMLIGTGVMDVSVQALWLQPGYDPLIFVKNFFLVGGNIFLALLLVTGLFFFLKEKPFLYLLAVLLTTGILWENFVQALAARHFYYLLPLLILLGVSVITKFLDMISVGFKQVSISYKGILVISKVMTIVLLLLCTNAYAFRFNELPGSSTTASRGSVGLGVKGGITEAIKYINFKPGDKIISTFPHDVYFYLGKADYYIQIELLLPISVSQFAPIPVHRISGSQVISNADELKDVLNKHKRVWLSIQSDYAAKEVLRGGAIYDPEIAKIVNENMRIVYEDWGILLYLWER
jgi:hypothetical protein